MSADYSPAAQRRAVHDEEQRDWLLGPVLAAMAAMAEGQRQMALETNRLSGVVDTLGVQLQTLAMVVPAVLGLAHQQQQDLATAARSLADLGQQDQAQAQRIADYEAQLADLTSQLQSFSAPPPAPAPADTSGSAAPPDTSTTAGV